MKMPIKYSYRADIDGLRAIAVGLVVVFHAGLGVSGGFVGVDVFFVISGYLISGLIMKQIQNDSFSLLHFWVRRIRRILPASVFVVSVTIVLGSILLLPSDFRNLATSTIAQQLMLSNVYFMKSIGYFHPHSETLPLLHTWSLAVEEQFYLGYPLLLVFLSRYTTRTVFIILSTLAVVSLIASEWAVFEYSSAAFYLLPFRAWELLLGGLLWFLPQFQQGVTGRLLANIQALSGAGCILWAGLLFDEQTTFPGISALLPCLGAALIIYSNSTHETVVGRLLSLRWVVFVGLVSYSFYLWHWPVFAFTRYWLGNELSYTVAMVCVAGSFLLAVISWKFVEIPFRQRGSIISSKRTFVGASVASIFILVVAVGLRYTDGAKFRFSEDALVYDERLTKNPMAKFNRKTEQLLNGQFPKIGVVVSGATDFLLWGDSHGLAVSTYLDTLSSELNVSGTVAARHATVPFLGMNTTSDKNQWNDLVFEYIRSQGIKNILFVSRWSNTFRPDTAGTEQGNRAIQKLRETLVLLQKLGCTVWLLNQVPQQHFDPTKRLWEAKLLGKPVPTGDSKSEYESVQQYSNDILKSFSDLARFVDTSSAFLDERGGTRIGDSDGSYYRDNDHLSYYGTEKMLGGPLSSILNQIREGRDK